MDCSRHQFIEINTDAACSVQLGKIGLRIIVRDHHGSILASSAQCVEASFTAQIAEALGILRGLQFVKESGLLPATLESDALPDWAKKKLKLEMHLQRRRSSSSLEMKQPPSMEVIGSPTMETQSPWLEIEVSPTMETQQEH
ncbi:hypothetical protein ACOSQ2_018511 [Xanthoceras sorbifolium]